MDHARIAQQFLNHEPIPGVRFKHNDYVRIIAGENAGKAGSLVTVVEVEPEPKFILELESGLDVQVVSLNCNMQTPTHC